MKVTAQSYREAALSRASTAQDLYEQKNSVAASYLAGLAVECTLRAYAHRAEKPFDARHDLWNWYQKSGFESVVPSSRRADISIALGLVVSHWNNSQRYYSLELLRAEWKNAELDRGVRGDFVKELTRRLVDAAWEIVTLGEEQWENSLRKLKSY